MFIRLIYYMYLYEVQILLNEVKNILYSFYNILDSRRVKSLIYKDNISNIRIKVYARVETLINIEEKHVN